MTTITTRIKDAQQLAEAEYATARDEYLRAYEIWVSNRTPENRTAMFDLAKRVERIRKEISKNRSNISERIANKQKRRPIFQWIRP